MTTITKNLGFLLAFFIWRLTRCCRLLSDCYCGSTVVTDWTIYLLTFIMSIIMSLCVFTSGVKVEA